MTARAAGPPPGKQRPALRQKSLPANPGVPGRAAFIVTVFLSKDLPVRADEYKMGVS